MHEAGDEYWLQYGLNPSQIRTIYIDTSTNDGTSAMEGILQKHVEDKTPRKNFKCDPNATIESFTHCAFNEIEDYECTPAINKIGSYFNETNICKTLDELNKNQHLIHSQLSKTLYSQSSNSSCIKPCKTASFEVSLQKKHYNGKLAQLIYEISPLIFMMFTISIMGKSTIENPHIFYSHFLNCC